MKDLLKTVEIFLTYSEAKLEELSEKNQKLKTDVPRKEGVKNKHEKAINSCNCCACIF